MSNNLPRNQKREDLPDQKSYQRCNLRFFLAEVTQRVGLAVFALQNKRNKADVLRSEIGKQEGILCVFEASISELEKRIAEEKAQWDKDGIAIQNLASALKDGTKCLEQKFKILRETKGHPDFEYVSRLRTLYKVANLLAEMRAVRKSRQGAGGGSSELSAYLIQAREDLADGQKKLCGYRFQLDSAKKTLATCEEELRREELAAVRQVTQAPVGAILIKEDLDSPFYYPRLG